MTAESLRGPFSRLVLPFLSIACVPAASAGQEASYRSHAELTADLRRVVGAHRDLARLHSLGKTRGGRDIWLVEIAGPGGAPAAERPAVFVAANLEGDGIVGSELAFAVADRLLARYAADPAVKARLDSTTFYIVPRVNPDAAEEMFAAVKTGRRTNATPYDDDNDARLDEDGPEDLNGDGQITLMRVPDRHGDYLIDPADARLMRRADPKKGERGTHTLHWEGLDNDGDGFYNEDPVGGVDLDRNFQHAYPYHARDAGRHMVSEPESRAVMDFLLAHRNVAALLTFGASDNLIVPGDTASNRYIALQRFAVLDSSLPAGRVPAAAPPAQDDLPYFTAVSGRYRALTGLREPPTVRPPQGALFEFGYQQFGVPSFSTPGWGLSTGGAAAKVPAGAIDGRVMQWLDSMKADGFVPWTSYKHPALGAVEIGGFKPYTVTNPPASSLSALKSAHAEFALFLASRLPRVAVASVAVKAHGGGLFRVTAKIENTGYFPTALSRAGRPTAVQLGVAPEAILAGAAKTSFIPSLGGSGRHETLEWLIRGKSGDRITLTVRSQKGGTVRQPIVLP
jgi:hypothetical protein